MVATSLRLVKYWVLVTLCASLLSCEVSERRKQLDSFSRVKTIATLLERAHEDSEQAITEEDISQITKSIGGGLDAWGRRIRVIRSPSKPSGDHVVLSLGRDGRFDFSSEAEYFTMQRVDIRGHLDRDIVFREGRCVTNAGKDPHSDFPSILD